MRAARVFFDARAFASNEDGARAFYLSLVFLSPTPFIVAAMNSTTSLPISTAEVTPAAPLGGALLALNNAHAQELSWLDPARLRHLVEQSFFARRVDPEFGQGVDRVDAFLL